MHPFKIDNKKCLTINKKARITAGLNILVFGVGYFTTGLLDGLVSLDSAVIPRYWIKKSRS
jgi:hypothetical protein